MNILGSMGDFKIIKMVNGNSYETLKLFENLTPFED